MDGKRGWREDQKAYSHLNLHGFFRSSVNVCLSLILSYSLIQDTLTYSHPSHCKIYVSGHRIGRISSFISVVLAVEPFMTLHYNIKVTDLRKKSSNRQVYNTYLNIKGRNCGKERCRCIGLFRVMMYLLFHVYLDQLWQCRSVCTSILYSYSAILFR